MRMPVAELTQRMPSSEFTMWMAYLQKHTLADESIPAVLAQIAAGFFNMFKAKGAKNVKPEDFIKPKQSSNTGLDPDRIRANFDAFMMMQGDK